jgi:hypothetical protein
MNVVSVCLPVMRYLCEFMNVDIFESYTSGNKILNVGSFITQIEELHNLYSSPSIIRIIKSRRMRWREEERVLGYW